MVRRILPRRAFSLLTALAILLAQTLAPAVAAARGAPLWMEICTAGGTVQRVAMPAADGAAAATAGVHCPFCLGPVWAPGLAPPGVTPRPGFTVLSFAPPAAAPVAGTRLRVPQPRGPPAA
jgi:hypothetical protein